MHRKTAASGEGQRFRGGTVVMGNFLEEMGSVRERRAFDPGRGVHVFLSGETSRGVVVCDRNRTFMNSTPTGLPLPPAPTAAEVEAAKFAAEWNPNMTWEQRATAPPKEAFVPPAPTGVRGARAIDQFTKNMTEILEAPDKARNTNWSELRAEQQAARDAAKAKPADIDVFDKLWNATTTPRRSGRVKTDVLSGRVSWSPSDR